MEVSSNFGSIKSGIALGNFLGTSRRETMGIVTPLTPITT